MSATASSTHEVPGIKELGPRFFEFVQKLERPAVFLDIEATGVDFQRDRIIEISLLRVSTRLGWSRIASISSSPGRWVRASARR